MERSRGWIFTINNYTFEDDEGIQRILPFCQYLTYGREVGESGTPHYQGFIYFKERKSLRFIKNYLTRAHLERQRGTCQQAWEYAQKDGDYIEVGERPEGPCAQGNKWKEVIQLAREGSMDQIFDKHPAILLRYYPRLLSLYRPRDPLILDTLENEWWFGPTGTGKSKLLWERYPQHYQKSLNKWWDSYAGEETVAIEEWSPKNEVTSSLLKIWADRYPFTGEIKGGSMPKLRPRRIIVLSNYSIEECFANSQDLDPIKRRFKTVQFYSF